VNGVAPAAHDSRNRVAVSVPHYLVIRDLYRYGMLPQGGALLEIGEANWYGDIKPLSMIDDIQRFVTDPVRRDALIARLREIVATEPPTFGFDIVKVYYELYFSPSEIQAIDFDGTPLARPLDLNYPIDLGRQFDTVINHGTAEHVFNIAQVFRTIHEHTVPGGLMLHESPFTGWIDHGFYSMQPTLFFDLAEFNGYALQGLLIANLVDQSAIQVRGREHLYELIREREIPENSVLLTILRKNPEESPFKVPFQGYYRESLPESGMEAWRNLR
jgi:hypothetical protein